MKKNTTIILVLIAILSIVAPAIGFLFTNQPSKTNRERFDAPPDILETCINLCKYYKNSSLIPIKCFSNTKYWVLADWSCGIDGYCPKSKHNIILDENCTVKEVK